jgi:hypothetical protein
MNTAATYFHPGLISGGKMRGLATERGSAWVSSKEEVTESGKRSILFWHGFNYSNKEFYFEDVRIINTYE